MRTINSFELGASHSLGGRTAEGKRLELKQARHVMFGGPSRLPGSLSITIQREHIVEQTLRCVGAVPCSDLLATEISISFDGERGLDFGGLRRDFFDSLGQGLLAAAGRDDGHFLLAPDGTLTPRPHEQRFQDLFAIGRLAGLAVWFGIPLSVPLSTVFCKFVLDVPISPIDLRGVDPDFYQFRVKPVMRDGGVGEFEAALGEPLMFVSAATEHRASTDLVLGGAEKRVTEDNKTEYLTLLCEHFLCGDMREQITMLLEGFWDIFPKDMLIRIGLDHRELALLICGYTLLDPVAWRRESRVGYGDEEVVEWFWGMVEDMLSEDRAKLLHFATGSSRLPTEGFAGLSPRFMVTVGEVEDSGNLPQSHTCDNQLVLPRYHSRAELHEKVTIALANNVGFGCV